MRLKSFTFLAFLTASLSIAACESLLPAEDDDEDETPTPSGTNTPTPTPSVAPTPVTTVNGDITTIDWGTIALAAGESPQFGFTAPTGTISIDFLALGGPADQATIFGFFSLVAPGNRTVIDVQGDAPARQAFAEAAMSFSVPSDDSAATAAASGFWRFHVFAADATAFVDSDPQILVKVRTAPSGIVPVGEIDVNVIVAAGVNGGAVDASAACTPGNPVYDGIAAASALYEANLGLSITPITLADCYDLPGAAFTDINGQDELGDLFETSGGIADQRINLYIVDSLSGFGNAAGIAGSVPIPMQVNGTRRSGVVIQYGTSTLNMAETIAHELGHSLGLFHTSEFNNGGDNDLLDLISDTPTCPGLGGGDPGNCPDDTNVMFPQLTGSFAGFSPGQGVVIAPAVHVRREGVSAFAPTAGWVRSHDPLPPWQGPPARCVDGVVSRF